VSCRDGAPIITQLSINQRLEAMVKQGRTFDEVITSAPTKDFDPKVGAQTAEGFLRQAYGGLQALARR
jgi:hypothetical protein